MSHGFAHWKCIWKQRWRWETSTETLESRVPFGTCLWHTTECTIPSSTDMILIINGMAIYMNNIKQWYFLAGDLPNPLKAQVALESQSVFVYHLDHQFHVGTEVPNGSCLTNQVKTRTLGSHRCICVSFQMVKGHPFWRLEEVKCPCLVGIALGTTCPICSSI